MAKSYNIKTSLTLDYRKRAWGIERIVLDTISNHLPSDSKGTVVQVWLVQGGESKALKDADPKAPVERIVMEDDGIGYDAGMLSVLFSPKGEGSLAVGQFGEGSKLAATACLRSGLSIEYRSRNWVATPYVKGEVIDFHKIQRLCFKIRENGEQIKGSRTVFLNPSKELVDEVFRLPQKVLAFNDAYTVLYEERSSILEKMYNLGPYKFDSKLIKNTYFFDEEHSYRHTPPLNVKPVTSTKSSNYKSRILQLPTPSIFVKGVRIRESHSLFSYDLGLDNICPDRSEIDRSELLTEIGSLLKECNNVDVVTKIITAAHHFPLAAYEEFNAFQDSTVLGLGRKYRHTEKREENDTSLAQSKINKILGGYNAWKVAFYKIFGDNAVLASSDTNVNSDATIMGHNPIKLNDHIENYLEGLGVVRADNIKNNHVYKWVPLEELTSAERDMLARVPEIDRVVIGAEAHIPVRVYSGLFLESGREITCAMGVHQRNKDGTKHIGIKRDMLQQYSDFVGVYVHELGHDQTGAADNTREFTDFFVRALAKLAIYQMDRSKA